MARQFKASTFFNKFFPSYIVQYTINKEVQSHYFYEFTDGCVDRTVVDYCESRMLVTLYSLLSIYEERIIVPSGKLVDLDDFSRSGFHFLKNLSLDYFHAAERFVAHRFVSRPLTLKFVSTSLNEDITLDEFNKTNFYSKSLLADEIICRAFDVLSCIQRHQMNAVEYILNFEIHKHPNFIPLATHCKLIFLPDVKNDDVLESFDTFVTDELNQFPENFEGFFEVDNTIHAFDEIPDNQNAVTMDLNECFKKNTHKRNDRIKQFKQKYSVDSNVFVDFINSIQSIMENNNALLLFKTINQASNKIKKLTKFFSIEVEQLKLKSQEQQLKDKTLDEFKTHIGHYSDINIRTDIISKISEHYDLSDGVKIFSHYPYSAKQYENQTYIPLMIKAPIKQITESMIEKVERLVDDFPHFDEVIKYIALTLKIRMKTTTILGFKHILIVGNHGIGKNVFTRKLNEILGYIGNTLNMNSIMAPFELSGMDAGWNGAAPGFFFKSLVKNNVANTVVILDDIDKVNKTNHGNINTCLIDLLEPASAKRYYENFFQSNLDLSNMSIIGLANTIEDIDRGVLDLFKVFTVRSPEVSDIGAIVFSIYKELKQDDIYSYIGLNNNELNEMVAKLIMSKVSSPRSIRKVLEESMHLKLIEAHSNNSDTKINCVEDDNSEMQSR